MKKFTKRLLALGLSATMVLGMTMTGFAANNATDGVMDTADEGLATPAAGAAAPVYSYDVTKVIVPTSLAVALNPMGLSVKTSSAAVASTSHIVSLNYGIANLSSKKKVVNVSFNVVDANDDNSDDDGNGNDLTLLDFVDTKNAAISDLTVITAATDPDSTPNSGDETEEVKGQAQYGEYKVYLAAVPAADAVTSTSDASPVTLSTITSGAAANATGANLSKVAITTFAEDFSVALNPTADGELDYLLQENTYVQKSTGGDIVIGTDAANDVGSKMELSALGANSITGFTITGEMNYNADWSKITAGITLTPTYTFSAAKGDEELAEYDDDNDSSTPDVATAAILKTAPAVTTITSGASAVTGQAWDYEATFTKGSNSTFTLTLANGDTITKAEISAAATGSWSANAGLTVSSNTVVLSSTVLGSLASGQARFVKITTSSGSMIIKVTVA